jgi:hypothetical protein
MHEREKFGTQDKIKYTYLSSPTCRSVNAKDIFNSAPWRKRSHGHRHYTSPIVHDVSLNDLLTFMQKPLGMHHIRSKLFSLPLLKLHALYNSCLVNNVTNPNSNEYKPTVIVLDIADHRLFKPVGIKKNEIDKRSFLKLSFANKGLDGINLPLHNEASTIQQNFSPTISFIINPSNLKCHYILRISL